VRWRVVPLPSLSTSGIWSAEPATLSGRRGECRGGAAGGATCQTPAAWRRRRVGVQSAERAANGSAAGWSMEGWRRRRRRWCGAVDLGRLGSLAVTPSPAGNAGQAGVGVWMSRAVSVLGWPWGTAFLGCLSWAADEDLLIETLGLGPGSSAQPRAQACPPTLFGHFSHSRKIKEERLERNEQLSVSLCFFLL
jgi:hypothetical protein